VRRLTNEQVRGKIGPMAQPRALAGVVAFTVLVAACTSGGDDGPPSPIGTQPGELVAQLATSDHYVGAPQRVSVGLFAADGRLVSFGSVDVIFSFVGTMQESVQPQPGPTATAVYLPTPGTPNGGTGPRLTEPSEGRGIYQAEDVTFDRAGFWQVDVVANVQGLGDERTSTTFPVLQDAAYPAPGDPAPETENLTIEDADVPPAAVDSRATGAGEIPDPELHRTTIADAIRAGHPALVIFSTPTFCLSRFCGPVTEVVEDLAKRYEDRAEFIHVEIWREYEPGQVINRAAADWLLRDGELTEPWLFLIGADGRIVDRWATLWRAEEVEAALEALPPMEA
jgi:hypothetical protein